MRERVVPKIDQILSKQEKFSFKIHSLFYLFLSTGSNSGASSSSSAEKSQSFPQTAFSPLSLSKKKTHLFFSLYISISLYLPSLSSPIHKSLKDLTFLSESQSLSLIIPQKFTPGQKILPPQNPSFSL